MSERSGPLEIAADTERKLANLEHRYNSSQAKLLAAETTVEEDREALTRVRSETLARIHESVDPDTNPVSYLRAVLDVNYPLTQRGYDLEIGLAPLQKALLDPTPIAIVGTGDEDTKDSHYPSGHAITFGISNGGLIVRRPTEEEEEDVWLAASEGVVTGIPLRKQSTFGYHDRWTYEGTPESAEDQIILLPDIARTTSLDTKAGLERAFEGVESNFRIAPRVIVCGPLAVSGLLNYLISHQQTEDTKATAAALTLGVDPRLIEGRKLSIIASELKDDFLKEAEFMARSTIVNTISERTEGLGLELRKEVGIEFTEETRQFCDILNTDIVYALVRGLKGAGDMINSDFYIPRSPDPRNDWMSESEARQLVADKINTRFNLNIKIEPEDLRPTGN